jgi:hypothetical protein
MCNCDKCSISIMKSLSNSKDRTDILVLTLSVNVNRLKCCHLLRTGKTSSIEGSVSQPRVMSVIFSAGSNAAKSLRMRLSTSIRSISTWRQLLTIYEEVSSVVMIRKATKVTSFRSLASSTVTSSFFSFFRRAISL